MASCVHGRIGQNAIAVDGLFPMRLHSQFTADLCQGWLVPKQEQRQLVAASTKSSKKGKHARKRQNEHHLWKRKDMPESGKKAVSLVKIVMPLSNVKEEIYAAMDEWVAFETDFPIVAVRKALERLRKQEQWQRIIQVSKWMLSKGQGQTMGTYDLMLQAYDMDARLEDAEALWEKLLALHTRSMPRKMFAHMMSIYKRREMSEKVLEVFKMMEKVGVKPDEGTLQRVGEVCVQLGMPEKQEELISKYPPTWKYYYAKGKRIRVPAMQAMESSNADLSRPLGPDISLGSDSTDYLDTLDFCTSTSEINVDDQNLRIPVSVDNYGRVNQV